MPDPTDLPRRHFLQMLAWTSALALLPLTAAAQGRITRHPRPTDPDWPAPEQWDSLRARVGGRLLQPTTPASTDNPFMLESQPGATQSSGWHNAWQSQPSSYAVAAESAADVAAAVDFARTHRLRIVVKGTGHDYLGRSNGKEALLVWTHAMRETRLHDRFVPQGAPATAPGYPALSVGAGTRWLEAYTAATTEGGRYVQGGGCASVGAAGGFPQGGGFGSWSKKFGTGAAGMLEAVVVTADGRILTVNQYQHPDLFWALRGGGGSTFGIVTRLTLLTHELPETFGVLHGKIQADSDSQYRSLIERLCRFYHEHLNNEHWGEQLAFRPDNSVDIYLTFQGLQPCEVEQCWAEIASEYSLKTEAMIIPARDMWNLSFWQQHYPDFVRSDGQHFWWAANVAEVGMHWYTYQSRYMPLEMFTQPARPAFADALFQASRLWPVSMHFNKGLAGASEDALRRGRETSVNPVVYQSAALAILGAGTRESVDEAEANHKLELVNRAMAILRSATPRSGAYANEADYFTEDWQHEFWGQHYPRLLAIKRRYDPLGLFHCHHGVGSEGWSADGMVFSPVQ